MADDSSMQIVTHLRSWIDAASPGARLPSTRELVAKHRVSPVTVQKALKQLAREGRVETRPGNGTFVRVRTSARLVDYGWQTFALSAPGSRPGVADAMRTTDPDIVAMHSGYPATDLLPERLVRTSLARAARGAHALSRPPVAGLPELQTWFAQELAEQCAAGVSAPIGRDVIVLPGSQSGLTSIFRTLAGVGQPVLIESPSYWGAISAAAATGVHAIPIHAGVDGPDPDEVERAFVGTGARVMYAQPNFANPTGAQWNPSIRAKIVDIVRAHKAFLVDDDWAHDFGIDTDSRPLAADDEAGHIVYLRSLTKSISPSIRVAALIARGPVRDRLLADRTNESLYVSGVLQAAALDVVTQPGWNTHLRRLRSQLKQRRDLLAASLAANTPSATLHGLPPGGLNLWARVGDGIDLPALVRACADSGVGIAGGDLWFPAEPTGQYVRLNFASAQPAQFGTATTVLEEALREQRRI